MNTLELCDKLSQLTEDEIGVGQSIGQFKENQPCKIHFS